MKALSERTQFLLAFLISLASIPVVAIVAWVLRTAYDELRFPNDGQSGMDAAAVGLIAGAIAVPGSFLVFKISLRALGARREPKPPTSVEKQRMPHS